MYLGKNAGDLQLVFKGLSEMPAEDMNLMMQSLSDDNSENTNYTTNESMTTEGNVIKISPISQYVSKDASRKISIKMAESEDIDMNNEKMSSDYYLQTFIEKIDRDQRDLKNDAREREARIAQSIKDAETRNSASYDRIEKMILSQNEVYEKNIERMEQKIDALTDKLDENKKYMHSTNVTLIIGAIGTILSIAAIGFAVVSVVTDILSVVPTP